MRGRQLESMACPRGALDDGREMTQFTLNFTKKGLFGKSVPVPISLQSVIRLRHPTTCLRHKDKSATRNHVRKRRK